MSRYDYPREMMERFEEFKMKCPKHGWVLVVDKHGITLVEPDKPVYCPECGIMLSTGEK
jgi:hypothetical protein